MKKNAWPVFKNKSISITLNSKKSLNIEQKDSNIDNGIIKNNGIQHAISFQINNISKATTIKKIEINISHLEEKEIIEEGVIDVNTLSVKVPQYIDNFSPMKYQAGIPIWGHQYIYNTEPIIYASKEQRLFYAHFKVSFINGTYFDLEGNSNYAFLFFFEMINEYNVLGDLAEIEKKFKFLENICPEIRSHTNRFLFTETKGRHKWCHSDRKEFEL